MRKLYELSQEYMLNGIEQMIRQEIINKSQSSMLAQDMALAINLLILADDLCCEEAIRICLIYISLKLAIYADYNRREKHWKFLIQGKALSAKTRVKLLGLFLNRKNEDSSNIKIDDHQSRSLINDEIKVISQELII